MRTFLFILLAGILFLGCEPDSSAPDELIDEETYERMFIEFAIINQLDQHLLKNTSRDELRDKVYAFWHFRRRIQDLS